MTIALKIIVHDRLKALERNTFEAARIGNLQRNFVDDILRGRKRSVKGDNLDKLARALDWDANQLLAALRGTADSPNENASQSEAQPARTLADADRLLVEVGLLRELIQEAMEGEGLSRRDASAYSAGVIESLVEHQGATTVLAIEVGRSRTNR